MIQHRGALLGCVVALAIGTGAQVASRSARADDGPAPPARTPLDPWLVRLHRGPESSDSARLLPWVEAMAAAGRSHADPATGALLLAGAASELARRGGAPAKARTLLEESLRSFSQDDPRSGLLWLDLADVRNDLGDPTGVLEALARADAVAHALGPRHEPHPGPQLRARLRDDLAGRGDGLRRHALSAVGRHAESATLWERRAAVAADGGVAWEWAAEEAWAAGDPERALRSIDRAIASANDGSPQDGRAVSRVAWRVRAEFGQLTERGDAAYRPARITDAMFTAWRAAVRDHGDRPGGFQLALDAASFAAAANRTDELIEFASAAFTSPGFAAEAARSVSRRLEIVAAARIALAGGEPAQALAWLRLAEHHHGGPLPRTEGFRLAIEEALRPRNDPRLPPPSTAAVERSDAHGGRASTSPVSAPGPLPTPTDVKAQPTAPPRDGPRPVGATDPPSSGARALLMLAAVAGLAGAALWLGGRRGPT